MKYIYFVLLFSCHFFVGSPRDSRELRIIHYNLNQPRLQRQNAFRIQRTRSLPMIIETLQETIIDIPHNQSEATVIESVHKTHHDEQPKTKKESCCTKHKSTIWIAVITTGGVISVSVMSTIVALVIHFAG